MNNVFKIWMIILFCGSFSFCKAQEIEFTAKEKNAINVLKSTLFIGNLTEAYYLDNKDFDYQRNDVGDLVMTPKVIPNIDDPLIGDKFSKYIIKMKVIPFGSIEIYNDCEKVGSITVLERDGDKIKMTGTNILTRGIFQYDTTNRVVAVNSRCSFQGSGNKKRGNVSMLKIGYDKNGILNEIVKETTFYKESYSTVLEDLTVDYTIIESTYKFEYVNQEKTIIKIDLFKKHENSSYKYENTIHTFSKTGNITIHEKVITNYKDNQIDSMRYLTKKEYDKANRLILKAKDEPYMLYSNLYSYDDNNNIIEESSKQKTKKDNSTYEIFYTNNFDERNLIKHSKKITKVNGNIVTTELINYSYMPVEEGTEITKCKNKSEISIDVYDAQGNLYIQYQGHKSRSFKNGVWGPWELNRL